MIKVKTIKRETYEETIDDIKNFIYSAKVDSVVDITISENNEALILYKEEI